MGKILAIDPGDQLSAWVLYDPSPSSFHYRICDFAKEPNEDLRSRLWARSFGPVELVIETFQPRGQPLYTQLVDTAIWIGRFLEAWGAGELLSRETVKLALLQSTRGKDANIIAALVARAGFSSLKEAKGTKKAPGPFYGVANDVWQALALAYVWAHGGHGVQPRGRPEGAQPTLGNGTFPPEH